MLYLVSSPARLVTKPCEAHWSFRGRPFSTCEGRLNDCNVRYDHLFIQIPLNQLLSTIGDLATC